MTSKKNKHFQSDKKARSLISKKDVGEFKDFIVGSITDIDSAFNEMFQFGPRIARSSDENNFYIAIELPGINKNLLSVKANEYSIEITVKENQKIKSETQSRTRDLFFSSFKSNLFYRQIPFYERIDVKNVKASYINGIIKITVPKIDKKSSQVRIK